MVAEHNEAVKNKDWKYFADLGSKVVACKMIRETTGKELREAVKIYDKYLKDKEEDKERKQKLILELLSYIYFTPKFEQFTQDTIREHIHFFFDKEEMEECLEIIKGKE